MAIFYFFQLLQHRIFCTTLQHSMQHAVSTPSAYPGPFKTCFFHIPVFGGKCFLIFPIIYQTVDLKLICIIGQSDLINSLIFADIYPGWHIYSLWGCLFQFHGQLALKFHWVKMYLYFELLSWSVMQLVLQHFMLKPVNWQIYLLMWANFARNWTCHLQRNYTGPRSSNTEDAFWIKITLGRQFV